MSPFEFEPSARVSSIVRNQWKFVCYCCDGPAKKKKLEYDGEGNEAGSSKRARKINWFQEETETLANLCSTADLASY